MTLVLNGTTGISAVDGTAATPAIQGNDSNTGIFFPAADTIAFAEGGAEVARIDSSGNVGIGVTPSAWFANSRVLQITSGANIEGRTNDGSTIQVGGNYYLDSAATYRYLTSNFAQRYTQAAGEHLWFTAPSGTAGNAISFTRSMTLDSSGNLLVGATSRFSGFAADNKFYVESSTGDYICHFRSTQATPYGPAISFSTAPNNTTSLFIDARDSSAQRFALRSNGGIANFSGNNVNLSDRREKTNFAPAGSYLSKICAIPVQTFNYIDQNLEEDPGLTLGVVAQDVQAVAPELVMESNWGTEEEPKQRLSIYQTDLQYALMKCIQEQQALIAALQADVAALKGQA